MKTTNAGKLKLDSAGLFIRADLINMPLFLFNIMDIG